MLQPALKAEIESWFRSWFGAWQVPTQIQLAFGTGFTSKSDTYCSAADVFICKGLGQWRKDDSTLHLRQLLIECTSSKLEVPTCNANQSLKTVSGEKEINYIGQATLHKCGAVGKTFNPRTGCALFDRSVSAFAMHWSLRWPWSLDLGGRSSWCLWRCVKPQLFHPPMRCDSMPWSDIAEDSNEPENIHK